MLTSLRIALRYLFSKKTHNAVNIISIVSMAGVAVATAAIVCVLSVFNGFSDMALGRMSKSDPQFKITPVEGKVIASADSLAASLTGLGEVAAAVAVIDENALAMHEGKQMAVTVHGVPEGYQNVTPIDSSIIDGGYYTANYVLPVATVSVGVAVRLQAYPSEQTLLSLYVPKRLGRINTANPMASFRSDSLFVGGVYRIEDNERDAQTVVIPIDMARGILQYDDGEATAIEVALRPGVSEAEGKEALTRALGAGFRVADRLEQEAESFRMISVEKWITFVMLAFILVIASFNVISTLSMLIIEKKSNLRTLRAMGATTGMLRRIFIWEGWLISVVGGLAGIIIGVGLCIAQQLGGFVKLNGDPSQLAIAVYPVRVEAVDIAVVAALLITVGLAIGLITSRFVPSAATPR
ncbi:MAG: FtsX-like permease family protein [Paramuribaculum sp.]